MTGLNASGATISTRAKFVLSCDVVDLKMDSYGFSGTSFAYTVIYRVTSPRGDVLYMQSFTRQAQGGRLWDISKVSEVVQRLMLEAYNDFARDIDQKHII